MRSTADHIFGVDEAILVTQWFHLDRALYTCDKLGIDGVGWRQARGTAMRPLCVRTVAIAARMTLPGCAF